MEEFTNRASLYLVGRVAAPALAWIGGRALGAGGWTQNKALLAGAAAFGATVVVSLQPEKSLDLLLGGIATTANYTSQALGVVANKIRSLEKADLEQIFNKQIEWLGPYFEPTTGKSGGGPLMIAPPPLLLPKDYTLNNFPYYVRSSFGGTHSQKINDPDVDPYLEAYFALGINVVPMILDNHQLPQLSLVREIYLQKIRQVHPDKSGTDTSGSAALLNDSYRKIKTLMNSTEAQFEVIRPVLQAFHKGHFPPTPYILLFFAGGFLSILFLRE
jgi:hypothetical protein